MREITLEVQGRCGDLVKLQVTTDTTPMLRLTLPALAPAELSSPAASFLRLNRDPANNVLHFLSPDDWLELESTSKGGRIAVAGSACWRREVGGKVAYLARRRALFRVSRAFQASLDGSSSHQCSARKFKAVELRRAGLLLSAEYVVTTAGTAVAYCSLRSVDVHRQRAVAFTSCGFPVCNIHRNEIKPVCIET